MTTRGPSLRISFMRSGDTVVIGLDGELDLATAEDLRAKLDDVAATIPAPARVIIDTEQLTFVDAAGLKPLLDAHRRLGPGVLRIRKAQRPVLRVIRLLDLGNMFGLDG